MAKYKNGNVSGKVGRVIHSSWNGRPYDRSMPETVANPRTEVQQAHRNAFAEISKLSSAMKEGHTEGLHWHAVRQKLNTHSVFKKLNKDCYGPNGIDYAHVVISKGTVQKVDITVVNLDEQGNLHVEFHDDCSIVENMHDKFFLFVFCPDIREGCFARPVKRTIGVIDAQIRDEWRGHDLHLYAFMQDPKGKTSDTMYIPITG